MSSRIRAMKVQLEFVRGSAMFAGETADAVIEVSLAAHLARKARGLSAITELFELDRLVRDTFFEPVVRIREIFVPVDGSWHFDTANRFRQIAKVTLVMPEGKPSEVSELDSLAVRAYGFGLAFQSGRSIERVFESHPYSGQIDILVRGVDELAYSVWLAHGRDELLEAHSVESKQTD